MDREERRIQAVTEALAWGDLPFFIKGRILGLDMRPLAELAVRALDEFDRENPAESPASVPFET